MFANSFVIHTKDEEDLKNAKSKITAYLLNIGLVYDPITPDFVFVLGGDGSLLRAIHQFPNAKLFHLVNTGHLGFFSDYRLEELDDCLKQFESGKFYLESIPFFEMKEQEKTHLFLNDIAIQAEKTCFLDVKLNGELVTSIRSTGIVVSTPIGSTGYCSSLSSPICLTSLPIYQYALIAPCYNALSPNPIVKGIVDERDESEVEVKAGNFKAFVDGIEIETNSNTFSFCHREMNEIKILHLKPFSTVKRIRKNVSGLEDL